MAEVRRAGPADAAAAAALLDAFNREYDEFTPGVEVLAERLAPLIESEEVLVWLAESDGKPSGIAVMLFRTSLWAPRPDAYLAELYVAPDRRDEGIGRGLLDAAIAAAREAGAEVIDLNTSTSDRAARVLYESAGFTNREGSSDGPSMLYYELGL